MVWLRLHRRVMLLSLFFAVLMLAAWGLVASIRGSQRGLPYHDSFARGRADEWKALGGTWELIDGSMRNDSDERGAKLLTGSPLWSDYAIDADVMLLGLGGDAGLILRSSNEEQGVNAYTGYYAGLRSIDNALVLGRADHGWLEVLERDAAYRRLPWAKHRPTSASPEARFVGLLRLQGDHRIECTSLQPRRAVDQ